MLKLVERGFFRSNPILLRENAGPSSQKPDVQVLRVGKFKHPKYGDFEITPKTLGEMKQNFDNKVRGIDVAFDYFHDSNKEASGWLEALYLSEDGSELWAKVDWTPTAAKMLSEREIRYFSPDFAFEWEDPETGVTYENVLFGGGLTNRPFVKDMAAIVAAEKEKETMTLVEIQAQIKKLSEDNKKDIEAVMAENAAMKKQLADMMAEKPKPAASPEAPADGGEPDADDMDSLKSQLAEAKKQLGEYAEKSKKAEEAKQMAEKENEFNIMLSEGKACVAQKQAYLKGDMKEFAKKAQAINLSEKGSAANRENSGVADGDKDERVLKLAEDKMKADPKLSKIDAISLAVKEVK